MSDKERETITTRIWQEESEPDNPFAARVCYCAGFDVYGDLLGKISWIQYLYLLFKREPPHAEQARLLEGLAVVLANPGPRDHSVRAAMNAGVSGSPRAAALMAAVSVGAGNLGGAREVWQAMHWWQACGQSLVNWQNMILSPPEDDQVDVWFTMEHPPGFDPNGESCPLPVRQALAYLASVSPGESLSWLARNREFLEEAAGLPLAFSGVAAAAFFDLGLNPAEAESLYLMLRLPGAAAHAIEQENYGWRRYPFFKDGLVLRKKASHEENSIVVDKVEF